MSKTTFSSKTDILGEFWLYYRADAKKQKAWQEFFAWADVALPLSFMVSKGYVDNATDDGVEMIEQAWVVFCEMIDIDPDEEFSTVADCFAASSHTEI
jgi:hypothetical protein